ncbi:MAG: polyphenol oxidase family protein [Nitriliruptor sp.]
MAPQVLTAELGPGVRAAVTGRDPEGLVTVGAAGNLSHRRPHRPDDLAAARRAVGAASGTDPVRWHLMHQVHGAAVGTVDETTPPGAELRNVDAVVTTLRDRPLVVLVADCVPLLLAGPSAIAAVHAGRVGFRAGVVEATLDHLAQLGDRADQLDALIGPAIGGCCYEVPETLRDEVAADHPGAVAATTWGTPSLDLPAAVTVVLEDAGVTRITSIGGCTRCDPDQRWFSHRQDPDAGRQAALVVRGGEVDG